jgi:ankyrin repeat protein
VFIPQTALHWAAKHGNADVVKLIAGTYEADVNVRSVSGNPLSVLLNWPFCRSPIGICSDLFSLFE